MKYDLEIILELSRDDVIRLYNNEENLYKWQPGLQSIKHLSGTAGEEGAKTELVFLMGKRKIVMTETIVGMKLPASYSATYEAKGVWNKIDNYFIDKGDGKTLWKTHNEFKSKGMMRLWTLFMPGAFKKQSYKYMEFFKGFAEGEGRKKLANND